MATVNRPRLQWFFELFDRRTGTEQIPVAIHIVDPRYRRPEFVFARPWRWECGLFARVRPVPLLGSDLPRGMRRVFQGIVFPIDLSARDRFDLCVDRDDRFAKT